MANQSPDSHVSIFLITYDIQMISLTENLLNQIIEHSKKEYPHEACGILAGREERIEKVYQMKNISEVPVTCYFMEPTEQLKVFKEIRELGMEMLAIYHSHINVPAHPSGKDLELAFYPEVSYLIVSLINREVSQVKSFRIEEGKISEDELKIIRE